MRLGFTGAFRRLIAIVPGLAFCLMLCIGLGVSPASVHAQDDPAALVLAAFDRLSEGYRFTYRNESVQTITDLEDVETIAYALYESTGAVDDEGGYRIEATNTGSEQPDGGGESMSYDFQRAAVDGVDYVYLSENALDAWQRLMPTDWEPGWRRLEDLTSFDTVLTRSLIDSILPATWPSRTTPRAPWILEIAESDPETIDGMAMRMFELTLDGAQVVVASAMESGTLELDNLPAQARLMAASTFEVEMRVWMGADDGHIYRVAADSFVLYPYRLFAEDDPSMPPYDYKTVSAVVYDMRDHGQVEPIAAPEVAAGG
ncbi:MAG: hypothetical protein IPK19_28665 [Chloroflexi bacterium]|nr:hypothetical protein [Chloroflexota bacterium]